MTGYAGDGERNRAMSMHKIPLTPTEEAGLKAHGLQRNIGKPSQLADVFRQGVAWGIAAERDRICAAIKEEDDHCSGGDYMLDSDDCIKVSRGEWNRPDWGAA